MTSAEKTDDEMDSSNSAVSEPSSLDTDTYNTSSNNNKTPPAPARRARKPPKSANHNFLARPPLSGTDTGNNNAGLQMTTLQTPNGQLQYQTSNGLLSVLSPFGNVAGGSVSGMSGSHGGNTVDMTSLQGTTVIMTQDGQQFLIPVSLGGDGQMQAVIGAGQTGKLQQSPSSSINSSSGNSNSTNNTANILSAANLTPQQHVMAEEAGRKREVRLLKNREAAKECRRKKKEYIKCLENRVAVLENQNKALIEELKSLKELYCKSTTHD